MIRFFFILLAIFVTATPALAGKPRIEVLPDGTQLECRTKLAVGEVYVGGGRGGYSRGSRSSRGSRGYGYGYSRGRVSTPYGGGSVGTREVCTVVSTPESRAAEAEEAAAESGSEPSAGPRIRVTRTGTTPSASSSSSTTTVEENKTERAIELGEEAARRAAEAEAERDEAYRREHEAREEMQRMRDARRREREESWWPF